MIGAAVVLMGYVITLVVWIYDLKDDATATTDNLLERDVSGLSAQQVGGWAENAADSASIFLAVLSAIIAGIYVLLAFLVKAGKNGARITATVFSVISLFGLLAGPLGWLVVALGVAGVAFMWLNTSSAYFAFKKGIARPPVPF